MGSKGQYHSQVRSRDQRGRGYLLLGFQGDAGGGPGEDGFEEDGGAGGVGGEVEGEAGVFHFGAVGEDVDSDLGGGEIAGGDGKALGGSGKAGADVVEVLANEDRAVNQGVLGSM